MQMTYPSGRTVQYTRDGIRRIAGINTTYNDETQTILSDITYRGDNQMTQCTYGNGLQDTRSYDLQGRLIKQSLQAADIVLDERAYTYDSNSNVLAIHTNHEDNAYHYDRKDRLTTDIINTNPAISF